MTERTNGTLVKLGAHEWDFRAGAGSKIADPLVAMKGTSGGAGEGAL